MVNQYSKIAEGKITNIPRFNTTDNVGKIFTVPLNLAFNPKRLFIVINPEDILKVADSMGELLLNKKVKFTMRGNYIEFEIMMTELNAKQFKFKIAESSSYAYINCKKWLAIGQEIEMDLKQNIDNTNELKNKVKLANTRIKETVIRGGLRF